MISSNNKVPPFASSNKPDLSIAPVKAPRFVPNSRLSIKVSGIAAQFCEIKGFVER